MAMRILGLMSAAILVSYAATAQAACPPIPFIFAQGAPFNAPQVNTNFTALRDCTNALALDPVTGPSASTDNEITVWDGTTGKIIKNGLGVPIVHTAGTPAIAADGSPLTSRNTTAFTASQILDAAFLLTPGAGAKNYDSMRAITYAPNGTSMNLITGLSTYVVTDATQSLAGGFPTAVGLFSAVVARGNNTSAWGVNTLMSDTMTGAVTTDPGKFLFNEFDFNIASPHTKAIGLQLAGGSKAQPAAAYGVVLQGLDINVGAHVGAVAKWSAFLQANPGSTNIFAGLSPKDSVGTNVHSQDIIMGFYDNAGAYSNLVLNASTDGGLEIYSQTNTARAVTLFGGDGGSFRVPDKGGFVINSRVVMFGDAALFAVGSDINYTEQRYGNAAAQTTIYGAAIKMALPVSAGTGGVFVCVDAAGTLYRNTTCP